MTPSYKGLMNTNPLDPLLLVLSKDLANHSRDSVPLTNLGSLEATITQAFEYHFQSPSSQEVANRANKLQWKK